MNYLSVETLTKTYGEKILFKDISFGVDKGQKVALIARNGTGKTTLLNILAGKEIPEDGKVIVRNDIRITYLEQNPDLDPNLSVINSLLNSDNEFIQAIKNYESILEEINIHNKSNSKDLELLTKQLEQTIQKMDGLSAWDFETRINEVLSRLKISNIKQNVGELSGGQRKRLALAKALIEDTDLMILDEPTNHLDIEMIEWLEEYLSKQNLSIILVTHDRYFLDNICDEIIELDSTNLFRYKGKYSYYLEKKAERMEIEKTELERARNLYRKELEWMRRMPQARTTKSKARIEAFSGLQQKASKRIETENLDLRITETRIGGKILEMHNVTKSFGDFLAVDDFTYTFKKGEHIGVCGKNGVGKTTLINMITGNLRQDKGKISIGQTVVFGYFSQEPIQLKEDRRVLDAVKDVAEYVKMGKNEMSASQFLNYFGFTHSVQYGYVSTLSGGERRRLQLLMVLIKNPNFLILDEPTNDLDIQTLNALEDFLIDFKGCLIIISHDRYFLDNLTDHLFVFEGGGRIKDFPGNYTEYALLKKKAAEKKKRIDKPKLNRVKPVIVEKTVRKLSYKESREFENLEKEISLLESEKYTLLEKLNGGEGSPEEFAQYGKRYNEIEKLIEEKTDRWLNLSELSEI
ncbi:MAG: ABC-F family ATP-binding cassette domain-containing protein [Bacteroidales bacterium]|jgi:ATP-binding cassette subfamily F protein uup|nr:ABC-F family ATP-binding cassette domain-containing protein [Bacteroidales bacterium]MDD4213803.1 ABC-F family ATP-binding cassette domain-containing protein [Bacteroidales bacterium]